MSTTTSIREIKMALDMSLYDEILERLREGLYMSAREVSPIESEIEEALYRGEIVVIVHKDGKNLFVNKDKIVKSLEPIYTLSPKSVVAQEIEFDAFEVNVNNHKTFQQITCKLLDLRNVVECCAYSYNGPLRVLKSKPLSDKDITFFTETGVLTKSQV